MNSLRKLSRNEMKNVVGAQAGQSCSVAVQQPNGSWITYPGKCAFKANWSSPNGVTIGGSYYCDIGTGNSHVITSNGGVSRCESSISNNV